jgi:uncharacterized protein (TIGR03435 family)
MDALRLACLTFLALPVCAQQFEVASVKLSTGDELKLPPFMPESAQLRMRMQGGPGTPSPERINYTGVTLKALLQRAYDVFPEQISGPEWIDTQRYTITAKVAPKTTPEQLRVMLQNLLADRFQLRLHRETKAFRTYHLAVAKNGPKLQPAEAAKAPITDPEERRKALNDALAATRAKVQATGYPSSSFHLPRATMADVAEQLSQRALDRPVIDDTHLDGRYAVGLIWMTEGARSREDATQGPSIFAAVQEQLGLELKSATDQLPALIIDSAEKTPTEN